MIGFAASPNTFGAVLVMLGFASAGAALQRVRDRDEWGWPVVIVIALVPAGYMIWLTGSRTALATPILALRSSPLHGSPAICFGGTAKSSSSPAPSASA